MIPEKKRGLASHFVFPYNEQQENPIFSFINRGCV